MTGARHLAVQASAAAVVFVALAADVLWHGPLTGLDDAVRDAVRAHQSAALRGVATGVTSVLSPPVTATALLLAAGACVVRTRSWRRPAALTALALAALLLLVVEVKVAVGRPAPIGPAGGEGYFPSGHTSSALVGLGTSVVLLVPPGRRRRAGLVAVAGLTAVVAVSLVYASYHWATDVVGAGAVGWLVLSLAVLLDRRLPGSHEPAAAAAARPAAVGDRPR